MFCFNFSEHYSMSNIFPKDSSKVSYTQKLIDSKKLDNFSKITLRVTETGPSRIYSGVISMHFMFFLLRSRCRMGVLFWVA